MKSSTSWAWPSTPAWRSRACCCPRWRSGWRRSWSCGPRTLPARHRSAPAGRLRRSRSAHVRVQERRRHRPCHCHSKHRAVGRRADHLATMAGGILQPYHATHRISLSFPHASWRHRFTSTARSALSDGTALQSLRFRKPAACQSQQGGQSCMATFVHSLSILIDLFETIVLNQEVTQNQSSRASRQRRISFDARRPR
jgi:hypothetical protein